MYIGYGLTRRSGQLPSRQAAQNAGIPWETKTETINKVCASGMRSVDLGRSLDSQPAKRERCCRRNGIDEQCPICSSKGTLGFRMGDAQLIDLMIYDGLTCSFTGAHMGNYGNVSAEDMEVLLERNRMSGHCVATNVLCRNRSGKLLKKLFQLRCRSEKGSLMFQ